MREKDIERHLRGEGEEAPDAAPAPAAPKEGGKERQKKETAGGAGESARRT